MFDDFCDAFQNQSVGLVQPGSLEDRKQSEGSGVLQSPTKTPIFSLASRMEFQVRQVHLELGAQWASSRLRWWCVLLPQSPVDFELVSWPKAATWQTVGEVIGGRPVWPEEAEHSLSWTAQEREAYANPAYGGDQRVFNLQGKAPTALHS